ncbi:MAG TPA: hypothetical protein VMT61_02340 [Candidatus Binataceae bacterium]|nr:hypothetical protein [Candidatus Binataceae bacterium]
MAMWIIYGQLCGAGYWLTAGLVGLAFAIAIVAEEYRHHAVKLMNSTSVGYFLLEMMIVLIAGPAFMQRYHLPIVWGVFAIVAAVTLVNGAPFTMEYTREQTAPDLWNSPTFYRMNLHLTIVWTLIFAIGTVLGAITIVAGHVMALGVVIPTAGMVIGFIFGSQYPKRFAAQFEAESHSHHNSSETLRKAARP